jgi:hypothetical protein
MFVPTGVNPAGLHPPIPGNGHGREGASRLVYKVSDDEIRLAACRYRYERLPKPYSAMRCHAQLHDVGMPARDDGLLQAPVAWSSV